MSRPANIKMAEFSAAPVGGTECIAETSFSANITDIIADITETLKPLILSLEGAVSKRNDKGSRELKVEECIRKFDTLFLRDDEISHDDVLRIEKAFENLLKVWDGFAIPSVITDYGLLVKENKSREEGSSETSRIKLEREMSEELHSKGSIAGKFLKFCKEKGHKPSFDVSEMTGITTRSVSRLMSSVVENIVA